MLSLVDVLIPNEVEARQLTGINVMNAETAETVAKILCDKGPRQIIITLSDKGAFFYSKQETIYSPAFNVKTVDATAAGDAFCAAYAVSYLKNLSPSESLFRANAAGALTTTTMGAEPSLPRVDAVEEFLQQNTLPDA